MEFVMDKKLDGKTYIVSEFGDVTFNAGKLREMTAFLHYLKNNRPLEYLEQWLNPLVKIYSDLTMAYPEMDKWIDHETLVSRAYRIYSENPEKYGSPKIGCDMLSRDIISEYKKDYKYYHVVKCGSSFWEQFIKKDCNTFRFWLSKNLIKDGRLKGSMSQEETAKTSAENVIKFVIYQSKNYLPKVIGGIEMSLLMKELLTEIAILNPMEYITDIDALWCYVRDETEKMTLDGKSDYILVLKRLTNNINYILRNERK